MANKKFSEFELKTTTSNVSHVVGYDGVENVRITPANFLDTTGGPYLPLAGGTMTGTNGVVFPDNFYLNLGTSSDFEIYHDGNNSYLKDQGTGELILASNGTGIKLEKTSGEKMIHALTDGAVELYYDSVKKLETTSLGATVTGDLLVTGTITGVGGSYLPLAGGTLTGALTGTSATFSGHLQAENRLTLTDAVAGATRYVITDETNTGTGSLVLQAGGGSAAYGGALGMYAHSHASKPGDVFAGISSASGGSFRVNTTGIDSGLDLLTINNTVAIFSPGSSEKMRLDSSGNLGVGTSTPDAPLSIQAGTNARCIRITGRAADDISEVDFYKNDNTTIQARFESLSTSFNINTYPSIPITFKTAGAERMRLDASGNLGVGTTNINRSGLGVDHTVLTLGKDTGMGMLELQGNRTSDADLGRVAWLNAGTRQAEIVSSRIDDNTSTQMLFRTSNAGSLATKMTIAKDGDVLLKGSNNPYTAANRGNITLNGSAGNIIAFTNNTSGTGYIFHDSTDLKILNAIAGNLTFSTNSTERMRISSGGDVLFGTTATPDGTSNYGSGFIDGGSGLRQLFQATSTSTSVSLQRFYNPNGNVGSISTSGTATAFNTSSDYRLKEDLQDFEGLDLVSKIPVYDYKWKADKSRSYGVMAHELEEVLPQAVTGEKDAEEMQSVDYSKIVPLLVKSIQELKTEIELLKNK
jgi:hypothetical protein